MGGFFLLCRAENEKRGDELRLLQIAFAEIGFAAPELIVDDNYIFAGFPKFQAKSAEVRHFPNGDFVFSCGTCISDLGVGLAAAEAFYRHSEELPAAIDAISGHYAVVWRKQRETLINLDRFGGYLVYYNETARVVSSSFYAISSMLRSLTLSRQAAYEYVYNGVVSGDETIFSEVAVAPIGACISVGADGLKIQRPAFIVSKTVTAETRCELLRQSIRLLDRHVGPIAKAFGGRIGTALSGGYNSRLMLACLRRHGASPRVYVYGHPTDTEVQLASAIARGEGFPLAVIDKDARPVLEPAQFAEVVRRNFLAADGYSYAGIFQNDAELGEFARRVAGNSIAFNGGGGEIFRNFFYLLDRPFRVRELLWAFYSQFDPGSSTSLFEAETYYRNLERKIAQLIGDDSPILPRPTVEWLYHNFRCRAWDSKTDSLANRCGYTAMPFLERRITEQGSQLPLCWKNHGAYEARLIESIDARLATYSSNYGHTFSGRLPLWRRASDYATYLRSPWLRRYTHRIKYRRSAERGGYLSAPYRDAALRDEPEITRRLFRLDRVADLEQYSRILSLEYLLRHFDSQLKLDF